MPVLLIADADPPEEACAQIADKMTPLIREAKGFICQAGAPDPAGGWRVGEIWESEQDGQKLVRPQQQAQPAARRHAEAHVLPASHHGHQIDNHLGSGHPRGRPHSVLATSRHQRRRSTCGEGNPSASLSPYRCRDQN
jgi:hypothetical protein